MAPWVLKGGMLPVRHMSVKQSACDLLWVLRWSKARGPSSCPQDAQHRKGVSHKNNCSDNPLSAVTKVGVTKCCRDWRRGDDVIPVLKGWLSCLEMEHHYF